MKKIIFIIIIVSSIISCNNANKSITTLSILNKTIFEPLNPMQIKEAVDIDTTFYSTYQIIQLNNLRYTDELQQSKFVGITYIRMHNYLKLIRENEAKIKEEEFSYNLHIKNDCLYRQTDILCFDYLDFSTIYFHKKLPAEQQPAVNLDYENKVDTSAIDSLGITY